MTCNIWWGDNHFPLFSAHYSSFYGFGVKKRFGGKGSLSYWMNISKGYKCVCITTPVMEGLKTTFINILECKNIFKELSLWADSFYNSKCLCNGLFAPTSQSPISKKIIFSEYHLKVLKFTVKSVKIQQTLSTRPDPLILIHILYFIITL